MTRTNRRPLAAPEPRRPAGSGESVADAADRIIPSEADPAVLAELADLCGTDDVGVELEYRRRLDRLAELLATLGVLCHRINNPLTSLLGRAQLLRARPETDPAVLKAQQNRDRAWDLTKQAQEAARTNDCAKVTELSAQVGALDPKFYGEVFLKDLAVQRCFVPAEPSTPAPAPATVPPPVPPAAPPVTP